MESLWGWGGWRCLFVVLLASCSQQAPRPCDPKTVADLPVTLDHNQIEVTGRLSGTETTFIIDTGAERSLVTAATANDMLLARSKLSVTRLTGIGGAVTNADVYADVQLGQARVQQRLAVAIFPGSVA